MYFGIVLMCVDYVLTSLRIAQADHEPLSEVVLSQSCESMRLGVRINRVKILFRGQTNKVWMNKMDFL
jgi:hypothetical protein